MQRSVPAFCILGVMALAACDRPSAAPITATTLEGKIRSGRAGGEEIRVWRDPGTGCEYLLWERRQRGAMTPRIGPDGQPMCRP